MMTESKYKHYTGKVKSYYTVDGAVSMKHPKYEYNLVNGIIVGEYREWWNNGQLRYIINYKTDGKRSIRHGSFIAFNTCGKVMYQRVYYNGKV